MLKCKILSISCALLLALFFTGCVSVIENTKGNRMDVITCNIYICVPLCHCEIIYEVVGRHVDWSNVEIGWDAVTAPYIASWRENSPSATGFPDLSFNFPIIYGNMSDTDISLKKTQVLQETLNDPHVFLISMQIGSHRWFNHHTELVFRYAP